MVATSICSGVADTLSVTGVAATPASCWSEGGWPSNREAERHVVVIPLASTICGCRPGVRVGEIKPNRESNYALERTDGRGYRVYC